MHGQSGRLFSFHDMMTTESALLRPQPRDGERDVLIKTPLTVKIDTFILVNHPHKRINLIPLK